MRIRVQEFHLADLYLGSQDDSAKILEEKAREAGVNVVYQTSSDFPTGGAALLPFLTNTIINSTFT